MQKIINLYFNGYYTEEDIPPTDIERSGVYIVYKGIGLTAGTCDLREIIYVGLSADISGRLDANHEKYAEWKAELRNREVLYFSYANTSEEDLAESALIYKLQPPCNKNKKESPPAESVLVNSFDSRSLIDSVISL